MRVDLMAKIKYRPEEYLKLKEVFYTDLSLFISKNHDGIFDSKLLDLLIYNSSELGFPELYLLLSIFKDDQQIKEKHFVELYKHLQFIERMTVQL